MLRFIGYADQLAEPVLLPVAESLSANEACPQLGERFDDGAPNESLHFETPLLDLRALGGAVIKQLLGQRFQQILLAVSGQHVAVEHGQVAVMTPVAQKAAHGLVEHVANLTDQPVGQRHQAHDFVAVHSSSSQPVAAHFKGSHLEFPDGGFATFQLEVEVVMFHFSFFRRPSTLLSASCFVLSIGRMLDVVGSLQPMEGGLHLRFERRIDGNTGGRQEVLLESAEGAVRVVKVLFKHSHGIQSSTNRLVAVISCQARYPPQICTLAEQGHPQPSPLCICCCQTICCLLPRLSTGLGPARHSFLFSLFHPDQHFV